MLGGPVRYEGREDKKEYPEVTVRESPDELTAWSR